MREVGAPSFVREGEEFGADVDADVSADADGF